MNDYHTRKSTGMTLLRHLAVRSGRAKNKNPNGIIGITVGDADNIVKEFKQMKFERDEALKLLGIRNIPEGKEKPIKKKVEANNKVSPVWLKVINNLK